MALCTFANFAFNLPFSSLKYLDRLTIIIPYVKDSIAQWVGPMCGFGKLWLDYIKMTFQMKPIPIACMWKTKTFTISTIAPWYSLLRYLLRTTFMTKTEKIQGKVRGFRSNWRWCGGGRSVASLECLCHYRYRAGQLSQTNVLVTMRPSCGWCDFSIDIGKGFSMW